MAVVLAISTEGHWKRLPDRGKRNHLFLFPTVAAPRASDALPGDGMRMICRPARALSPQERVETWELTMIVLDGGMGRELARVGAPFRQPEWSALALIEKPETVRTVHDSFAQARADVLTTNAYAVVPIISAKIVSRGTAPGLPDLRRNRTGVRRCGHPAPACGRVDPAALRLVQADLFEADRAHGLWGSGEGAGGSVRPASRRDLKH